MICKICSTKIKARSIENISNEYSCIICKFTLDIKRIGKIFCLIPSPPEDKIFGYQVEIDNGYWIIKKVSMSWKLTIINEFYYNLNVHDIVNNDFVDISKIKSKLEVVLMLK